MKKIGTKLQTLESLQDFKTFESLADFLHIGVRQRHVPSRVGHQHNFVDPQMTAPTGANTVDEGGKRFPQGGKLLREMVQSLNLVRIKQHRVMSRKLATADVEECHLVLINPGLAVDSHFNLDPLFRGHRHFLIQGILDGRLGQARRVRRSPSTTALYYAHPFLIQQLAVGAHEDHGHLQVDAYNFIDIIMVQRQHDG